MRERGWAVVEEAATDVIVREQAIGVSEPRRSGDFIDKIGVRRFPGTGLVTLAEHTGRGEVCRDDVAAVLAAILAEPGTAGRTLVLIGGNTPIEEAVRAEGAS